MHTPPPAILSYILPFSILFSRPVWQNALVLFFGAILAKGKRTVTSCLRIMGLKDEENFPKYHWVLSHAKWSSLMASRILLGLIIKVAGTLSPLVMVIDDTLERRKGKKIKAKGYYRDAVRSSEKTVVKCFGLKWITLAVLIKFPWSERRWALPFMTVLEPSERSNQASKKRHKTCVDWSIQMLKQVRRWLPGAALTILGDGGYATAAFCWVCLWLKISLVSRLRMDARLYDFPPERVPGARGRPPKKGKRLMSFKDMLNEQGLPWKDVEVRGYAGKRHVVRYITDTALWHVEGYEPVPIRWVLVVDPAGKLDPLPLFSTDVNFSAEQVINLFIERWSIEVTFEEVRSHMGVETQRQWSNGAIARTTPALMGIFSLVCLMANAILGGKELEKGEAAWYQKDNGTFSDVLTLVRKELWRWRYFSWFDKNGMSRENQDYEKAAWLMDILASAA
jgi:DDE superfamily endonuclease